MLEGIAGGTNVRRARINVRGDSLFIMPFDLRLEFGCVPTKLVLNEASWHGVEVLATATFGQLPPPAGHRVRPARRPRMASAGVDWPLAAHLHAELDVMLGHVDVSANDGRRAVVQARRAPDYGFAFDRMEPASGIGPLRPLNVGRA